ncbi:MAG: hypothetical protein A3F72_19925 [Bacteroidetes bacterium RIFCSPLOWO2_12_FULL_35_15]|nr:MAG: hypothetical protein A3F72_19925 [Bacteroidetes bacterium RIFCSPLOWO2_12_FULL_35_15]
MRIKVKPIDFDDIDWYEKQCEYTQCSIPTFFTDNILAKFCCDKHRFKENQLKNKSKNDQLRFFAQQFKANYLGLKKLYEKGIIHPTKQELRIVDFSLKTRKPSIKIEEGLGYQYFDYILLINKDDTFRIIKEKKQHDVQTGLSFRRSKNVSSLQRI